MILVELVGMVQTIKSQFSKNEFQEKMAFSLKTPFIHKQESFAALFIQIS